MPPVLELGGVLRFNGLSHFAAVYARELCSGRMTAIDTAHPQLFSKDDYMVVISGITTRYPFVGQCVYRQGDVVGLQLELTEAIRSQIEQLIRSTVHGADASDAVPPSLIPDHSVPANATRESHGLESGGRQTDPGYVGLLLDTNHLIQGKPQASDGRSDQRLPTQPPKTRAVTSKPSAPNQQGPLRDMEEVGDLFRENGVPTLFKVCRDLHRACTAGRLTVLTGEGYHSFDFDAHGCVVDFTSDFAQWLGQNGLLSQDEIRRLPRAVTVRETFTYLSSNMQKFPQLSLKSINQSLLEGLVHSVALLGKMKGARYVFEPLSEVGSRTIFNVPFVVYGAALLSDLVHNTRAKIFEDLFDARSELYPTIEKHGAWGPDLLKLDLQEQRFTDKFIPKGQTLRALLVSSPMSRRKTFHLLVVLTAFDMLKFCKMPPADAEELDIVGRLQTRHARCDEGHFQTLGIHVTAHPSEIHTAFDEIKSRYSPTSDLSQHSAEAKALCVGLIARAEASRHFLSDQGRRIQYRSEMYTQTELFGFAQLLIDKLKLAMLRENTKKTRRLHEVAMELAPRMVRAELRQLKGIVEDPE
jgi:hypothetical protein